MKRNLFYCVLLLAVAGSFTGSSFKQRSTLAHLSNSSLDKLRSAQLQTVVEHRNHFFVNIEQSDVPGDRDYTLWTDNCNLVAMHWVRQGRIAPRNERGLRLILLFSPTGGIGVGAVISRNNPYYIQWLVTLGEGRTILHYRSEFACGPDFQCTVEDILRLANEDLIVIAEGVERRNVSERPFVR